MKGKIRWEGEEYDDRETAKILCRAIVISIDPKFSSSAAIEKLSKLQK